jgi:hypothetical protein
VTEQAYLVGTAGRGGGDEIRLSAPVICYPLTVSWLTKMI